MQVPDFSLWSPILSQADLAAALAAAGVLWGYPASYSYPFPDEVNELALELRKKLLNNKGIVRWHEPSFLTQRYVRHTLPSSLAEAWKVAVSSELGSLLDGIHLEAMLTSYAHLAWYAQILNNQANIRTFYVYEQPASAYLDWRWPLRIGFLPDEEGIAHQMRFQAWLHEKEWAQGILRLVDSQASETTVDILFLPDARQILPQLEMAPVPVLANCLFAFSYNGDTLDSFAAHLADYQALTQAKGFVYADAAATTFEQWLDPLFRELSHNWPFDEALYAAAAQATNSPANALFFGSQFFIQAAKTVAQAERLVNELKSLSYTYINLDERSAGYLGLPAGSHVARVISDRLHENQAKFGYYRESDEATTLSTLSLATEQESTAVTALESIQKDIARFMQHQLVDVTNLAVNDLLGSVLTAGHVYRLRVRIGPQADEWRSAEKSFPEGELPQTDSGHHLVVVLTEPKHLPKPQVKTIFLPVAGTSTTCDFHFSISPEYDLFEGRVLVLYQNRVLQTALLRSPVYRPPAQVPEGQLEFTIEGVVRPLAAGLNGRTAYDTAFVFNHASDGEWTATRMSGLQAATISLAGVKESTENIMRLFNASDWEGKSFDRLDAEETLKLLCTLALHGAQLYRTLAKDMQVPERLLNSEHIQAIMAREDYHLPIELCYQRRPPKSTATLCAHAEKQFRNGELGVKCLETCTTKEQESDYICPLAFWGLNRVIEWHQYRPKDAKALVGGDYRLQNEPTPRKGQIKPLQQILVGASDRIQAKDVDQFNHFVQNDLKVQPVRVLSWDKWEDEIENPQPRTLVLMVHTEIKQNTPSMEINGEFLDPPYIDENQVVAPGAEPPLVLLLGCGTRYADVPNQSLAAEFRMSGAAIVISTLAELLDSHAPRLARAILAEVAKPSMSQRSFGEVLLAVKRQSLLAGLPIALALVAYGDADWWV